MMQHFVAKFEDNSNESEQLHFNGSMNTWMASGSLAEMEIADGDRKESFARKENILLLDDFQQSVELKHLIALLLDRNADGNDSSPLSPSTAGNVPIQSISFGDLQSGNFQGKLRHDTLFSEKKNRFASNLQPFRNYLIAKIKGKQRKNSAFSLYPGLTNFAHFCFFLEIEKAFLEKMVNCLKDPVISAELVIEDDEDGINFEGFAALKDLLKPCPRQKKLLKLELPPGHCLADPKGFFGSLQRGGLESLNIYWTVKLEWKVSSGTTETSSIDPIKLNGEVYLQKLRNIYNSENDSSKDVTILGSKNAKVKAHGMILKMHSRILSSMLSSSNTEQNEVRSKSVIILERNVSQKGLEVFIRFLYGFKISKSELTSELLVGLIHLAVKLEVEELLKSLKEFICMDGVGKMKWMTVNSILKIYFYVKDVENLEELREHCLILLAGLPDPIADIKSSAFYKDLIQKKPEDVVELFAELVAWK